MKNLFTLVLSFIGSVACLQAQWQNVPITALPQGVGILKMYQDGNTLWAGSIGQIFKSTDQGATWTEASTGLQSGISGNSGITRVGNRVYASFSGNGDYYAYYTTDEGQNWNIDTAGWTTIVGIKPAAVQLLTYKDYVLARLESNFILYKKNTDAAWNTLTVPDGFRTPGYMYAVGDTLILGAGRIALTTDMGANWVIREPNWAPGLPLGFINGMFQDRDNPAVLFGNYQVLSNSKPKYFYTKNNQASWDSFNVDVDQPAAISGMYIKGNEIYVAFSGTFNAADTLKKIFHSTDGGLSWTNVTENLYSLASFKFHSISSIEVVNGNVFVAGFSSGLYKRTGGSSGLNFVNRHETLRVYPNPATEHITIDEQVTNLEITDMSGKTVVARTGKCEGETQISHLAPGLYIVKAQKNGQQLVSKFIKN
jgi:photosystem II stability/assembly factor-like uncharacterized protein